MRQSRTGRALAIPCHIYRFNPPEAVTGLPAQQPRHSREQPHWHSPGRSSGGGDSHPADDPGGLGFSRQRSGAAAVVGLERETGTPLAPRVYRDASAGYVIAELYQDVGMDVRSGTYDRDGALLDGYWNHTAATQTCSVDLVLADQHGRDEIAPTATPRPPDPTATPALVVLPAIWVGATPTMVVADRLVRAVPPTPAQTPTPYPTATPVVVSATGWDHWQGRPLAIEADGVAVLDLPRDAAVSAYLSVRTGPDSGHGSHTELARMLLPAPQWELGSAYVALAHASGRILLDRDAVDATYRAAVLHLEASPLADCNGLRLRWQRSAAVVVRALTDQPFDAWSAGTPDATLAGLALSDVTLAPAFVPWAYDYTAAVANSVASANVTPTVAHSGASYTISLGGALQSTDAAAAVTLAVGDNVITVAVTAEDGSQQNYVITIQRGNS